MVSELMRIAFVTGHMPLTDVKKHITSDNIIKKTQLLNTSLIQDFGIRKPKIAILGLNPHAGEEGLLGAEENETISPTVKKLKAAGIIAFGPYPADSFFTNKNLTQFDGILCMYHDQGLTAFKTLSFSDGVNYTAGLNVVRTSPVHGTAYEIAGKGLADVQSFREAVFMACEIHKKRAEFKLLNENPLEFKSKK
jgi:4-hydroxythreonine-4-phosphate dehydrogenase